MLACDICGDTLPCAVKIMVLGRARICQACHAEEWSVGSVGPEALIAELLRPEREGVLKTAWSRYTSAKRATRKGWPKGKKRTKQKRKAPRGAMPAKG